MFSWFRDSWSRSSAFSESELAILRILLPRHDPIAETLYAQAAHAPYVQPTMIASNAYAATIPYVINDKILIECDIDINSPCITVQSDAGATLSFYTGIARGGFLKGLNGSCRDTNIWPKKWEARV